MGWNKPRIVTPDYILFLFQLVTGYISLSTISIESSFSARPDNVELPHLSGLGGLSLDISPLEIIWS